MRLSTLALSLPFLVALGSCSSPPPPPPYTEYKAVTAGGAHTCALTIADLALCWGSNAAGQLGDGSTTASSKPVLVAGNLKFSTISAGVSHTCGLSQGEVYCWGSNLSGEIGNGAGPKGEPVTAPAKIVGPANTSYIDVVAGGSFSCAVTKIGWAFCWGQNGFGKLGLGPNYPVGRFIDSAEPNESVATPAPVAGRHVFQAITAHDNNACGLSSTNQVFCWGSNLFFQVGATTSDGCQVGASRRWPCAWSPTITAQRQATSVPNGVTLGDDFACYTDDRFDLYCWGSNAHGQIAPKGTRLEICKFANDTSSECAGAPRKVTRPVVGTTTLGFVRVAAGSDWVCSSVQPAGSAVVCWGRNTHGQLGDGQTIDREAPAPISGGYGAMDISAGTGHTCLVTDGATPKRVYCWGANASGQLGNGATSPHEATPQLVVER